MAGPTIILIAIALIALIAVPLIFEAMRQPMEATARRQADGQFVTLSQGVTYFDWLGPVRGPVAVCVHGLTTPSFVWRGMARGMALMGYRVLIYDLYGRGYSDRPAGPQDAAFFLQQLQDLLESQEVEEDFTLLGYSMGGAIATCFAAMSPRKVRQLVLIAPAGMGVKANWLMRFIAQTPVIGDWLMLAVFPRLHRRSINAERSLPTSVENVADLKLQELHYKGFVLSVLASMRGFLSRPLKQEHLSLHDAGVPVLAVWGRHDRVIPITAVGILAEWSRNAKQEIVDDAGHGLIYTHTDAVLAAMRETLHEGLS